MKSELFSHKKFSRKILRKKQREKKRNTKKNTEKSNENAEKYLGNSESDGDRVSVSKG